MCVFMLAYAFVCIFVCVPVFLYILAGYACYVSQFFQKNLKFYVSTFIEIVKLFELFLKTHPSKLFKSYEYMHTHYFMSQYVRSSVADNEDTRRPFVQFKCSFQ